jgi:uncharacterized protein
MKIAVTGATGFVGRRLIEQLGAAGHTVIALVRNLERGRQRFPQDKFGFVTLVVYTPDSLGDWSAALSGCDGVVNLAGEPLFDQRWTPTSKQVIHDSRVLTTQVLTAAIAQASPMPKVLVSASAVGYYGTSETERFTEHSAAGTDFLAGVCQDWEASAQEGTPDPTRLVILRIGIVLGPDGGALQRMITPFKLFGGGPIGTGQQWVPWIHRDDLVALMMRALEDQRMVGVYNATAPNPVRMAPFAQTLGAVLQRPSWLPVPGLVLDMVLGEAAKVVLEGQQVIPERTMAQGFAYAYPELKEALQQIFVG